MCECARSLSPGAVRRRLTTCITKRTRRAVLLHVTTAAGYRRLMFCRVLYPALMEAGAGKQNAVVVTVVRRYAGLVVVARPRLLSSSIATVMTIPRRWRGPWV